MFGLVTNPNPIVRVRVGQLTLTISVQVEPLTQQLST